MPGPADAPGPTALLPGDLDTDSEDELSADQIIQREERRVLEQAATARAAAQLVSETERTPARPSTSRWRAPSIVGAFRSRPVSQVPSQTQSREHSIPGTFIDSPDIPRRPRNDTSPPEDPDPPPPAPEDTMADPGPARAPPPKLPDLPKFSGEGEDLKLNKLQRWFKTMRKCLAKSGITDDTPDVADWYGM